MTFHIRDVFESALAPHLKATASALLTFADRDGRNMRPSVARLAWMLGKTEKATRTDLSQLIALGVLTVTSDHGRTGGRNRRRTTEYAFNAAALPTRAGWQNPEAHFHVSGQKLGSPLPTLVTNPEVDGPKPGSPLPETRKSTSENPEVHFRRSAIDLPEDLPGDQPVARTERATAPAGAIPQRQRTPKPRPRTHADRRADRHAKRHQGCYPSLGCQRGRCVEDWLGEQWENLTSLDYTQAFIQRRLALIDPNNPPGDDARTWWKSQWLDEHGSDVATTKGAATVRAGRNLEAKLRHGYTSPYGTTPIRYDRAAAVSAHNLAVSERVIQEMLAEQNTIDVHPHPARRTA